MELTFKEKIFLRQLLAGHSLAGLSSEYAEDDKKAFKENYGMTFKQAEKAMSKLKELLKN